MKLIVNSRVINECISKCLNSATETFKIDIETSQSEIGFRVEGVLISKMYGIDRSNGKEDINYNTLCFINRYLKILSERPVTLFISKKEIEIIDDVARITIKNL